MNYVILLGICQSLIALLLLPASQQKRPANVWLRWLLACICIHLTIKFVIFTTVSSVEIRRSFTTFVGFAYGPLLWMFAQKLKNDRYRPSRHWYVFLPSIICAFVYLFISVYTARHGQEPVVIMYWYNKVTEYICQGNIIFPLLALRTARSLAPFWKIEKRLLIQLSAILIVLSSISVVFLYIVPLTPGFSYEQATIIGRTTAYSCLLLACLLIIRYEMSLQRILGQNLQATTLPEPAMTVEEASFLYDHAPVVAQPVAVICTPAVQEVAAAEQETPTPIRKPLLDDVQQASLIERLTQLMEKQKPYTDPSLSLEKLAALLKIPRNQASELMNQYIGKSFYQYINEYRIREVIVLLDKCTRRNIVPNILTLAFEAGFHSKSSFNLYFKKVTGHTPSAYLKGEHLGENASTAFNVLGREGGAPHYS